MQKCGVFIVCHWPGFVVFPSKSKFKTEEVKQQVKRENNRNSKIERKKLWKFKTTPISQNSDCKRRFYVKLDCVKVVSFF